MRQGLPPVVPEGCPNPGRPAQPMPTTTLHVRCRATPSRAVAIGSELGSYGVHVPTDVKRRTIPPVLVPFGSCGPQEGVAHGFTQPLGHHLRDFRNSTAVIA